MNAGASPKVRAAWRALALSFVIVVVALRIGSVGCGTTSNAPKRAAGAAPRAP